MCRPVVPIAIAASCKMRVAIESNDKRAAATLRVRARDGAYELLERSYGSYWMPAGESASLALQFGAQSAGIYGPIQKGDTVLDCGLPPQG
jgi:hypothetical protein